MKILVDADACPVVSIVEHVASNIGYQSFSCVIRTMYCGRRTAKSRWLEPVQMQWTLHWSVYARKETLW